MILDNVESRAFYRHAFATTAQVYDGVSERIEVFYNRYRRHPAIEYISPGAYELTLNQPTIALKAAQLTIHSLRAS